MTKIVIIIVYHFFEKLWNVSLEEHKFIIVTCSDLNYMDRWEVALGRKLSPRLPELKSRILKRTISNRSFKKIPKAPNSTKRKHLSNVASTKFCHASHASNARIQHHTKQDPEFVHISLKEKSHNIKKMSCSLDRGVHDTHSGEVRTVCCPTISLVALSTEL